MNLNPQGRLFAIGFLSALLIAGCERQPQQTQAPPEPKRAQPARSEVRPPQPAPSEQPADEAPLAPHATGAGDAARTGKSDQQPDSAQPPQPPRSPDAAAPKQTGRMPKPGAGATVEGNQLKHEGLLMTIPAGWENVDVGPTTPMGPKAVLKIPGEGDQSATVRITHYPEMKGPERDELNIDRWLGQVTRPDGSPTPRDEAKIEKKEKGDIRLTILDAKGAVKMTMRDSPQPGSRMIAAIIDHPKGPHFLVAAGPEAVMDKAAADVLAFIESAKVEP